MSKYKTINGYTKESMKAAIIAGNNGQRAFNDDGHQCAYLSSNGNKCAVGCFIPNGHKGQRYGLAVERLLNEFPDLKEHMPLEDGLIAFQRQHDNARHGDVRKVLCDWIDANVEDGVQ